MIERMHLNILREIERQGSLTAAAEALHLTQPALSHAIKKLEAQIGSPLWLKDGRRIQFTEAGNYLLSVANRLIPQLQHSDQVLKEFASGERGSLRIGMECHPCYQWLLKVMTPFMQEWPDIEIDVKQQFQFGGMAALFNYEIDALITPDPLQKKGISFQPVFDYELVLAVAKSHPLSHKLYIRAKDLSEQTLLTYPVESSRLDIFSQFLIPGGYSPLRHKHIEATEIMLQMVAANRGVTALPRWLIEEYSQTIDIHPLRLGQKGIYKKIYIGGRLDEMNKHPISTFLSAALNT